jgi:hypothetical protein
LATFIAQALSFDQVADGSVAIRLARLVLARGQAEAGADLLGGPEAIRLVHRSAEG